MTQDEEKITLNKIMLASFLVGLIALGIYIGYFILHKEEPELVPTKYTEEVKEEVKKETVFIPLKDKSQPVFREYVSCFSNCHEELTTTEALQLIIDTEGYKYVPKSTEKAKLTK